MYVPTRCNQAAYGLFVNQLSHLDSTWGLVRAAIAVSMHALEDVEPQRIEEQIRALAARVKKRVRGPQRQARLAHLHDVLFEEEGFTGNTASYYSPLNSYLPVVLESREGIPVTLSLIYKAVADLLDLKVVGLNTPYHFLVEVRGPHERMVIDPFLRGRLLTPDEVRQLTNDPRLVPPVATHRQWLSRIIANLQQGFAMNGHCADFAAMTELQETLQAGNWRAKTCERRAESRDG